MSVKVNELPIELTPSLTDSTINDTGNVTTKRTTWQKVFDLFVASGISANETYAKAIVAAGTNQATATTLSVTVNRIDTVASGTGVKNVASEAAGFRRTVQNNGANDLVYYPFLGSNFYIIGSGALGANSGVTIAPGNQVSVIAYSTGELTLI